MAAIDIDMSEFTQKTTLASTDFITGTLADGSAVKIKVSDLASVVAGIFNLNYWFKPRGWLNSTNDLNMITDNGCYAISGKPLNSPITYGMFFSFNVDGYKIQIAISSMNDNIVQYRSGWPDFSNWKSLVIS